MKRSLVFVIICLMYELVSANISFSNNSFSEIIAKPRGGFKIIKDSSRVAHFKSILKLVENSKLIDFKKEIVFQDLKNHDFFQKLLDWKHLYKFENLDTLPKGEILSVQLKCKSNNKFEDFQIWYFDDIALAELEFNRFEKLSNGMSVFEKPFKFFFRKKNMIFYISMNNWSHKESCSPEVIELIAKEYYDYNVDYSHSQYISGRKRNKLSSKAH